MKAQLANLLLRLWGKMSFATAHRIAIVISKILYCFNIKLRRIIEINLALCFPEKTAAELTTLTKRALTEKIKEIAESPAIWTKPHQQLLAQFTEVTGIEAIEQDIQNKRPVMLLGAHLGAFYMVNAYLSPKVHATQLYKPQKGIIETLMQQRRNDYGSDFVPTNQQGVKALFKRLQTGGVVGAICDHSPGTNGGVFVPFFKIQTWTMNLTAKLIGKYQPRSYFTILQRLAPGKGFHLHIIPADDAIYQQDIIASTTAMNKQLENIIRQFPEQYDWSYKRFRHRPEGEPNLY